MQLQIEQYSGKCEVRRIHGTAARFALAAARSCLSHASCDAAGEAYGSATNRNAERVQSPGPRKSNMQTSAPVQREIGDAQGA